MRSVFVAIDKKILMKLYPIVLVFILHEVYSAKVHYGGIIYSTNCNKKSGVRGVYTCTKQTLNGLKPNACSVYRCFTCALSDVKTVQNDPNELEYVITLTPIKLPACDPIITILQIDNANNHSSQLDRLLLMDPFFTTDLPSVTIRTQDTKLSTDIEKVFNFYVNSYNADDPITIECDENLETRIQSNVVANPGKILTKRSVTVKMNEKLLNYKKDYSFKLAIPGEYINQKHESNYIRYTPTYNPTLTCESTSTYNRKFKCKLVSLYDFVEIKITHEMRNFKFSIKNSEKKKENSVFKEEFEIDVECPLRLLDVETFSFTVHVMQTSDHKMFEETFTESHILLPAEHEPYVNCVQRQTSTEQCNYNFYNCQVVCTSHILKLQSESENYVLVTKETKGIKHKDLYDHSFSLKINFKPGADTNNQTFKLIFNSEGGKKILDCDLPHTFRCDKRKKPQDIVPKINTNRYPEQETANKNRKIQNHDDNNNNNNNSNNNNNIQNPVKKEQKKQKDKFDAGGTSDSMEHSRSVSNSLRFGLPVVIISILGGIVIGMYLMRKRKHWRFSSRNFGNVKNSMINVDLYDKTLN